MKFTLADTTERYRSTLTRMAPGRVAALGESWANAPLAFFFGADRERASFSVRDTLVPMLAEDNRMLNDATMRELLASITLEDRGGDVAERICDAYIASKPAPLAGESPEPPLPHKRGWGRAMPPVPMAPPAMALPESPRPSVGSEDVASPDNEVVVVGAKKPTSPAPPFHMVRVFYSTDRAQTEENGKTNYGGRPDGEGELQYGECEVSIPETHEIGNLESPSFLHLQFTPDPKKHVMLQTVLPLNEAVFFERVAEQGSKSPDGDAFVFVHGYNVSFTDAARRTAQLKEDLKFSGCPIFFSWPAAGRLLDYLADEASVIWARGHLETFLTLLAQRAGARKIHLIAHSMGNRAVCDALDRMSMRTASPGSPILHHLVLTAPDIDAGTFRQMAAAIRSNASRVTLYASSKDKALVASAKIHGNKKRAGEPIVVLPNLDSIDASTVSTDFLSHGYFAQDRSVLDDLHALFTLDTPPSLRFQLKSVTDKNGSYYAFRK